MATITAASGGGNWSATTTWTGAVVPGASDDVLLNAGSGNVTIDANSQCGTLDCTGYTGTLTHVATVTLTVAGLKLLFVAGMTYTVGSATTSLLAFTATAGTCLITTGGKTMPGQTYQGVGGSWTYQDAHTTPSTATVTLTAGSLSTGSQTVSWGLFASSVGSATRSLTAGASSITLTGTGSVFGVQFGIGFTLIAGTSTFTASGASILFQFVGGMTFYNLVFTGLSPKFVAAASASCTVNNLTITGTAVKTGAVALGGGSSTGGGTITVAGTLTIAGNSVTNRLLVQSGGGNTTNVGVALTISCANPPVLSNIDLMDITATGAGGVWTGASMGDCQGNSGITFDPSVMQTRSGAGGNWSTAANWTSRVPLPQDDVVVGAGASGTITLDMSRGGRSINYTGFAGTLTHSVLVSTFGNLTFSAGMTITNSNIILSGRGAYTLTTAGQALLNNFAVAAPGGTYTFADNLVVATGSLVCSFGSLTTMYNVTAQYFSLLTTGTITFGPGTWTTTQTTIGSVVTVGATTIVSAASSTIVIGGAGSALRTFAGAGKTYGNLVYTVAASTGALAITGVNTFGMITIGSARTVTFPSGATTSVGGLSIRGVSGSPTTVNSSTPGTQATISSPAGVVAACDWLVLQDSKTAGGAAFYAGADSINVSDNTGWNFTSVALIVMSCAASSSASMTVTPPAQLALASSATSGGVRANFSATVVTSQTFEAASAAQTSMTAVAQ